MAKMFKSSVKSDCCDCGYYDIITFIDSGNWVKFQCTECRKIEIFSFDEYELFLLECKKRKDFDIDEVIRRIRSDILEDNAK